MGPVCAYRTISITYAVHGLPGKRRVSSSKSEIDLGFPELLDDLLRGVSLSTHLIPPSLHLTPNLLDAGWSGLLGEGHMAEAGSGRRLPSSPHGRFGATRHADVISAAVQVIVKEVGISRVNRPLATPV